MTEHQESVQPALDFSRIQETSEGDLDFERELFEIYLEDCQERLIRLRTAIQQGNSKAVLLEAHTIKGASANVGTTLLQDLAFTLEQADSTAIAESGAETLDQLDAEFARVKVAITEYLSKL